jgi:hypothetical protein
MECHSPSDKAGGFELTTHQHIDQNFSGKQGDFDPISTQTKALLSIEDDHINIML